ncbi:hypothetical protein VP1G_11272 [Cytospora mali]|uniref:Vegetative cell wall protein gp1 n=1 Tax=Cytospora mali TaxID=578113 RepID=A0A194VA13_CYTMA|nr:hypothetical protein VP1G_11272 [Valsa mali var. pyri (nom. inval.)]
MQYGWEPSRGQAYNQGYPVSPPVDSYPGSPERPRRPTVYYRYVSDTNNQRSPRRQRPRPNSKRSSKVESNDQTGEGSSSKILTEQRDRRPATEEDARRFDIPQGYDRKYWDPEEEPILLLGSIFDANSIGRWIFDWAVHRYGRATPLANIAGDLWLLLVRLWGNAKLSNEHLEEVQNTEDEDILRDFIDSGKKKLDELRNLLKACEQPMLSAQNEDRELGDQSGFELVETLFGRDRKLEDTEKLMQSIRLWNFRWKENCEPILKSRRNGEH